ncbi:hypothetical protein [Niabella hibiscisoli]|uniref:hypothetical protein n=1 Tax=Niabella hibiscisoli TaxID=1825928 RepID=UPI001F1000E1|nr:hypothetical protein [Niabella hibiscisoli]MCH5720895.1 hypothetical protein [Niabella hibiscisoli]
MHKAVGDTPVIFENSYVLPSLYTYYFPDAKALDYNTKSYRKTNYNLENDCRLSGQKVWHYQITGEHDSALTYIDTKYNPGLLHPIEKFTCVNALKIIPQHLPEKLKTSASFPIQVELQNKSDQTITLYNELEINYAFLLLSPISLMQTAVIKLKAILLLPDKRPGFPLI